MNNFKIGLQFLRECDYNVSSFPNRIICEIGETISAHREWVEEDRALYGSPIFTPHQVRIFGLQEEDEFYSEF